MKNLVIICACLTVVAACNKPEEKVAEPAVESKPQTAEFADPKYVEMGKKDLAALNANNLDAYLASFADNAKYFWSSGDSLIGKAAIGAFWKERFATVVDSARFFNDIWTPLKVNVSQQRNDVPGVWLLSWYQVSVKYRNGAKLSYWVHTDLHYNSADKIDIAILYMDRAPIVAALAKK